MGHRERTFRHGGGGWRRSRHGTAAGRGGSERERVCSSVEKSFSMELQPNGTVTAVEYVNGGAKMERDSSDDKAAKQVDEGGTSKTKKRNK